jgi:hypothetical protein
VWVAGAEQIAEVRSDGGCAGKDSVFIVALDDRVDAGLRRVSNRYVQVAAIDVHAHARSRALGFDLHYAAFRFRPTLDS